MSKHSTFLGKLPNECSKEHRIVLTTKGKKDLRLSLNSVVKRELASIRNLRSREFIFNQTGDRPLDAINFKSRMWFKNLEEAGIKRIREHDSGHTFASLFKMYAGDIYDLKVLLNHCNCTVEVRSIQP